MGLFNLLSRKNGQTNTTDSFNPGGFTTTEIPEEIFIEKEKPKETQQEAITVAKRPDVGISLLFEFLERNYEAKGFDDALINSDNTHLEQNIQALKSEMERVVRKVKTFYEDFIREIDFHISSRSRSGMIDTVEELLTKKVTAESHIKQVKEIEQEALQNKGIGQGIILSYTRGFRNGLASISDHSILRIQF